MPSQPHILFVNGSSWGGSLASTRLLAENLGPLGVEASILARETMGERLQPRLHKRLENLEAHLRSTPIRGIVSWLVRRPGSRPVRCTREGAAVAEWRSSVPANACATLVEELGCDVVIVSSVLRPQWRQIRRDMVDREIPCVFYLREDALLDHLDPGSPPNLLIVNSEALREQVHARGLNCHFLPSPVHAPRLADVPRDHVLVVNFHESYGGSSALALAARCPEIPFVFQDSWNAEPQRVAEMKRRVSEAGVANVEVRPFTSHVEKVYEGAALLLVPYLSEIASARPRSVMEALACGIPVLASDLPGLREVAGEAGTFVPADAPTERWAEVLRSIWGDSRLGGEWAERSRHRFAEAEVSAPAVARRFLDRLTEAGIIHLESECSLNCRRAGRPTGRS